MTALPMTTEILARARQLLEAEQPHPTLESACKALHKTLGMPVQSDGASLTIKAAPKSAGNSTQELWGVLHAAAPDIVFFVRNGKIGVLRRTSTTVSSIVFLVAWLTYTKESSRNTATPVLCWSRSESSPWCVTENKMLFLPNEQWNEIKAWLDERLPTVSPPIN